MASLAPVPACCAPARKLRVGVFADSARQPRWIVEALAKVASSSFAEIVAICIPPERGQSGDRPGSQRGLTPVVWSGFSRLDRRMFGAAADWSALCDIETLVPPSRRMACEDLSAAQGAPLDVAFAIGDVDDATLDGMARHGTWRYCFGEGQGTNEALAGVREVIDGVPATASGLRIRVGNGAADRIALESWSRTLPMSVAKSRDNVFAKSSEFIARALRELHSAGPAWLEERTAPAKAQSKEAFPGTAGVLRDMARMGARLAQRATSKIRQVEQWSLAYRFTQIEPWSASLEGFFRLEPPKDRFWADPFPIQRGGKSYIFFEELPFAAGKAHISVVEVDREGRASEPVRVLERDYHLSYPFLVEDQGELYMIPETAHNNTVEVYRCVDFPYKWRRERVLLDGFYGADATLHRGDGRWWMFLNSAANGAEMHDELHIYSADKLLGEWKPHRRNPVKSDARSARPAGKLFTQSGKLYRPAQICAPLYGSGVCINRVTHLSHDDFLEEEERRLVTAPESGLLGLHTINRAGDLSVVDVFARRSRF